MRFLKAAIEGNHLALTNETLRQGGARQGAQAHRSPRSSTSATTDFKAQSPLNMEPSVKGAENVIAQIRRRRQPEPRRLHGHALIEELEEGRLLHDMQQKYGSAKRPCRKSIIGNDRAIACSGLLLGLQGASAQSVEEFYKGQQINMLIGGGAGGGYDVYYRALGRHLGKHIPGHPNIIPKNQPAASGLAAAARSTPPPTRTAQPSPHFRTTSRWTRCSAIRPRATTRSS